MARDPPAAPAPPHRRRFGGGFRRVAPVRDENATSTGLELEPASARDVGKPRVRSSKIEAQGIPTPRGRVASDCSSGL